MIPLVMIRHGPTDWTEAGRIQGHANRPLSTAGRARVAKWRLPPDLAGPEWIWLSSPLARARETAALLAPTGTEVRVEPALIEMDWGEWEGRRLTDLRAEGGARVAAAEARGLDFRPPGGESPRDAQARLAPMLRALGAAGRPVVAVAHKGIIRALAARATGWDMTGDPPEKLRDWCAHRFVLGQSGTVRAVRLNVALEP